MSLTSSLYIGMSGMRTNESAIGVIGNNIANINTIGFKGSRAVFADLLSKSVLGSAGASQAGQGAALAAVQRMVTQGALLGTNVTTDLAVQGEGYFIASNPNGDRFFTRNGQLQMDNEGYLTTINGLRLQGYPANAQGVIQNGIGDLQVGRITSPPQATTSVDMVVNLGRDEEIQPPFDPNDTPGTSSHTSTITVYDSLGGAHQLEVYYTQTAPGEWSWNAVTTQGALDGSDSTDPAIVASGNLVFDQNGNLVSETQNSAPIPFFGATPQDITFDFGDELANGGDGTGSTSYAGLSSNISENQDGFAVGSLLFVEVGTDGTITGTFSNGREQALAQLALARFQAPHELNAIGGNLFAETQRSGQPAIGAAGAGGRGDILSGALEQSNVDLTNEFTNLILAQRGFQAASRTITTADEMLAEVVNLKR
jgi:flagellar hook protein FlgE